MKKTILITGGTGYIGSHTAVELIGAGFDVVIVDNLSNSGTYPLKAIETITGKTIPFIKADCCDIKKLKNIFDTYPFVAVIHFAAVKAVGESVQKPLEYYRNNILSLINVLDLMREFNVSNLIFSSSCAVYGTPEILPVTESTPFQKAASPYGNTKKVSEEIITDTVGALKGDLKAVNLRYFNPIGAHPSGIMGEIPSGVPSNLVPHLTQTAAGIRDRLRVYGNDYSTPDGSPVRDYIDIMDLASAHVAALKRLLTDRNKTDNEFFNIGTGRGLSVLEVIRFFEKANHLKIDYEFAPRREGDIPEIWADPSLANREMDWKAVVPIEETLQNTWKWEQYARAKMIF